MGLSRVWESHSEIGADRMLYARSLLLSVPSQSAAQFDKVRSRGADWRLISLWICDPVRTHYPRGIQEPQTAVIVYVEIGNQISSSHSMLNLVDFRLIVENRSPESSDVGFI